MNRRDAKRLALETLHDRSRKHDKFVEDMLKSVIANLPPDMHQALLKKMIGENHMPPLVLP